MGKGGGERAGGQASETNDDQRTSEKSADAQENQEDSFETGTSLLVVRVGRGVLMGHGDEQQIERGGDYADGVGAG